MLLSSCDPKNVKIINYKTATNDKTVSANFRTRVPFEQWNISSHQSIAEIISKCRLFTSLLLGCQLCRHKQVVLNEGLATPKPSVWFESPESFMDSCTDSRILTQMDLQNYSWIPAQIHGFWHRWIFRIIHGFLHRYTDSDSRILTQTDLQNHSWIPTPIHAFWFTDSWIKTRVYEDSSSCEPLGFKCDICLDMLTTNLSVCIFSANDIFRFV